MENSKYLWLAFLELLRITVLFLLVILLLNPELNSSRTLLLLWLGVPLFIVPALFIEVYLRPQRSGALLRIVFFAKLLSLVLSVALFLIIFSFFLFLFNFRPEYFLNVSTATIDFLAGSYLWITPLTRGLTLLVTVIDLFFCFFLLSLLRRQPDFERKIETPEPVLPDMQATQVEEE